MVSIRGEIVSKVRIISKKLKSIMSLDGNVKSPVETTWIFYTVNFRWKKKCVPTFDQIWFKYLLQINIESRWKTTSTTTEHAHLFYPPPPLSSSIHERALLPAQPDAYQRPDREIRGYGGGGGE